MMLLLVVMLTHETKRDVSLLTFSGKMSLFPGHNSTPASGDGTSVLINTEE